MSSFPEGRRGRSCGRDGSDRAGCFSTASGSAAIIQRILAIPPKRFDRQLVTYLTEPEVTALLAAPDTDTPTGQRDHALLVLAIQTGLRVSELTALTCADIRLGVGAHVNTARSGGDQNVLGNVGGGSGPPGDSRGGN
jgi:integrase